MFVTETSTSNSIWSCPYDTELSSLLDSWKDKSNKYFLDFHLVLSLPLHWLNRNRSDLYITSVVWWKVPHSRFLTYLIMYCYLCVDVDPSCHIGSVSWPGLSNRGYSAFFIDSNWYLTYVTLWLFPMVISLYFCLTTPGARLSKGVVSFVLVLLNMHVSRCC